MLFNLIKPAADDTNDDLDDDDDESPNISNKIAMTNSTPTNAQGGKLSASNNQFRIEPLTYSFSLFIEGEMLRNKVKFVAKMMKLNKVLR